MTWFAHQIFADDRPPVRAELGRAFGRALYEIGDREVPAEYSQIPELAERLRIPRPGLLFVRELCDPGTAGFPGDWFGSAAISWLVEDLHPEEEVLTPEVVFSGEPRPEWAPPGDSRPPVELLRMLSGLSRTSDTVVSLYCAHTWGGDWEYAYAWIFEPGTGAGKVYVHQRPSGDIEGVQVWDPRRPGSPRELIADGDVLTLVLEHHGIHLDGGYFHPHTRSFDWDEFRVGAARS